MGTNINLKTESFAFLDSSRFKTTEWCKARTTTLVLPDRTSNSSSCLSSLVNATPRYLNFSTCFNDTPPTCKRHWKGFLERCRTSVLEELNFIPARLHAAVKPFNACWRPGFEEASKTKSSAKKQPTHFAFSDCDILFDSAELVHPVHENYEKER